MSLSSGQLYRWTFGVALASVLGMAFPLWAQAERDTRCEALIRELQSGDQLARVLAAKALGELRHARAIGPLTTCLKDKDWIVRQCAAAALGRLGDPHAVEPLTPCLKDEEWAVRRAAAAALGALGDARALKPLVRCLEDPDAGVRRGAAEALGKVGYSPTAPEAKAQYLVCRGEYAAAAKLGPPALGPLMACLKDTSAGAHEAAADALCTVGPAALDPLLGCLTDETAVVRRAAVRALGNLADVRAVNPLMGCLKDEEAMVRAAAAALGGIRDARAIGPLAACLNDADAGLRQSAAIALARQGDVRGVEGLIALLREKDFGRRLSAANALTAFGDARAVEPLITCLTDWDMRTVAGRALGRLGWTPMTDEQHVYWHVATRGKTWLEANADTAKAVLLADLGSDAPRKVEYAACALIAVGREDAVAELKAALNQKGTEGLAQTLGSCGHKELFEAAEAWAAARGRPLRSGPGTFRVPWGCLE